MTIAPQSSVSVARRAHDLGFQTIWLNDNVRYRNIFTVLTAIAAQVPIKVGTATIVPYFHNPITLACTIASLSDVCQGREVRVGIAIGDLGQTPPYVEFTQRRSMLRESTLFLKQALAGDTAYFRDFPTLVRYFRLNPEGKLKLAFGAAGSLPFYGGTLGPKSLAIAGEHMEGIVFPGQFLAFFKTGRLKSMMQAAKDAATRSDSKKKLRFSALLNVSVSKDRKKARQFALPQVAHSVVSLKVAQFTPEEFRQSRYRPRTAWTSPGSLHQWRGSHH